MKKLLVSIMIGAVMLTAGATGVFAAVENSNNNPSDESVQTVSDDTENPSISPSYVDENNDGICDNYDGTCPQDGTGAQNRNRARGSSYVDADNDGICDNSNGTCPQDGTGAQNRNRARSSSYIDANGDGICDNYNGTCPQDGTGAQNRKGRN